MIRNDDKKEFCFCYLKKAEACRSSRLSSGALGPAGPRQLAHQMGRVALEG